MGLSQPSDPVSILLAQIPDQPAVPTVTRNFDQIEVSWVEPYDGDSAITSY